MKALLIGLVIAAALFVGGVNFQAETPSVSTEVQVASADHQWPWIVYWGPPYNQRVAISHWVDPYWGHDQWEVVQYCEYGYWYWAGVWEYYFVEVWQVVWYYGSPEFWDGNWGWMAAWWDPCWYNGY